jgi:DNA-binding transcriptional LysR family regulator
VSGPNYSADAADSVPLILFPEGCAYRNCAVAALRDHQQPWHLSFVSPSFECLKSAAVEGMGITVLARALVTPPLRVVRHGLRLPQLPTIELAYSFGRRSNSRLVGELAHYLADSLVNAGTAPAPRMAS